MRARCSRRAHPASHGGAHSSKSASSASSPTAGQGAGAGTANLRINSTRACHWRKSDVHGSASMPICRNPVSIAASTACGSASARSSLARTRAPSRRSRRARTACSRASQAISTRSSICAAKWCRRSASAIGAARKIFASRSAPSSSAATRNGDFASACGSAKRAPRPFASRYRLPSPRARAMRSGYASASKTPAIASRSAVSAPPRANSRRHSAALRAAFAVARASAEIPEGSAARSPASAATRKRISASRAPGAACRMSRSPRIAARSQARPCRAQVARLRQHVREPRMRAHSRKRAAVSRDAIVGVDRLQAPQQIARLREMRGRRRVEPAQGARIGGAPDAELERERREVRVQDLGFGPRVQRELRALRPEAVANARRQAAGAAAALIRRGLRYFRGDEPAHPGCRIEFSIAAQARVDDDPHALDREAGLGDRGREHDFAHDPASARRAPRPARPRAVRRTAAARAPRAAAAVPRAAAVRAESRPRPAESKARRLRRRAGRRR